MLCGTCLNRVVSVDAASVPTPQGAAELLQLLRDGRPRTRSDLVEESGLARSTVGARVDALLASGLLASVGEAASTGGRPPTRFAFNRHARIALGFDIGATHATVAVTDLAGQPLAARTWSLAIDDGPEVVLTSVTRAARELIREAGRTEAELIGVGVGLPGPVEHSTGRPTNPPIMPGWDGYDVPSRLARHFPVPVLVDNDVNVMALGEHAVAFGAEEHLIFVKVATGIGSGIISGGRLHRGAQGAAGDLGHIQAPHGAGIACRCGNTGCLEAVASGSALAKALRELGIAAESSQDVVALVRAGNLEATRLLRQAGRDIGDVLAMCVSLLNPSVIVVGGSLADAGETLLAGVREAVYRRSLPLATEHLRIVASQAREGAGVMGSALMVIQQVLSPQGLDIPLADIRG